MMPTRATQVRASWVTYNDIAHVCADRMVDTLDDDEPIPGLLELPEGRVA
jgi:hypothetical protein